MTPMDEAQKRRQKAWHFFDRSRLFYRRQYLLPQRGPLHQQTKEWANSPFLEENELPEECWKEGWDDFIRGVLNLLHESLFRDNGFKQQHPDFPYHEFEE